MDQRIITYYVCFLGLIVLVQAQQTSNSSNTENSASNLTAITEKGVYLENAESNNSQSNDNKIDPHIIRRSQVGNGIPVAGEGLNSPGGFEIIATSYVDPNNVNPAQASVQAVVQTTGGIVPSPDIIYTAPISLNELISPDDISGHENKIQCTREGELHKMWSPLLKCMVCACVQVSGYLKPMCASCSDCVGAPPLVPQETTNIEGAKLDENVLFPLPDQQPVWPFPVIESKNVPVPPVSPQLDQVWPSNEQPLVLPVVPKLPVVPVFDTQPPIPASPHILALPTTLPVVVPVENSYPAVVPVENAKLTNQEKGDVIAWPPRNTVSPLPGQPPHESCAPYPPGLPFQHPWNECLVCTCSQVQLGGRSEIEVNCYTKPSCCIPLNPALGTGTGNNYLLGQSQAQTHLKILDNICDFKSFGVEFVHPADACRICSCTVYGLYVVPVCKRVNNVQCNNAVAPVDGKLITYIEPRCRHIVPNQPFPVGCNTCKCQTIFTFVVVTCTTYKCSGVNNVPGITFTGTVQNNGIVGIQNSRPLYKIPQSLANINAGHQSISNIAAGYQYLDSVAQSASSGPTVAPTNVISQTNLETRQFPDSYFQGNIPALNNYAPTNSLSSSPFGPASISSSQVSTKGQSFSYPASLVSQGFTSPNSISQFGKTYGLQPTVAPFQLDNSQFLSGSVASQNPIVDNSYLNPYGKPSIVYAPSNLQIPGSFGAGGQTYKIDQSFFSNIAKPEQHNTISFSPSVSTPYQIQTANTNAESIATQNLLSPGYQYIQNPSTFGPTSIPSVVVTSAPINALALNDHSSSNINVIPKALVQTPNSAVSSALSQNALNNFPVSPPYSGSSYSYVQNAIPGGAAAGHSSASSYSASSSTYPVSPIGYSQSSSSQASGFQSNLYPNPVWSGSVNQQIQPVSEKYSWDLTNTIPQNNLNADVKVKVVASAANSRGPGQCKYDGDIYHENCQACFCFTNDNGLLDSSCLGTPCSNN